MRTTKAKNLVLLSLLAASCTTRQPQNTNVQSSSDDTSSQITVDTANRMIQSYLNSIAPDSTDTIHPALHSLILDAAAFRSYLADTSVKNVKIMFAHTQQYMNTGHEGQPAGLRSGELTIIIAGYNSSGNYVLTGSGMVMDRAVPCPRNCPVNGTSSGDLLQ